MSVRLDVSTSAADLGVSQGQDQGADAFADLLGQAGTEAPALSGKGPTAPGPTLRLDIPGSNNLVDPSPFRQETSGKTGDGGSFRIQTGGPDMEGAPNDITGVRFTGPLGGDAQYLLQGSPTGVTGGVGVSGPSGAVSGTVTQTLTEGAPNPTRIGGQALLKPDPEGNLGVLVGGSTNRLDGSRPGTSSVEAGAFIQTAPGLDAALNPKGVTLGVRRNESFNPAASGDKTTSTDEAFVRANGVQLTPSTSLDAEVSGRLDGSSQSVSGNLRWQVDGDNSLRLEGRYTRNEAGPDVGSDAVIFENRH
jgi:hypothetical protein